MNELRLRRKGTEVDAEGGRGEMLGTEMKRETQREREREPAEKERDATHEQ